MEEAVYPLVTTELAQRRKDLAPATHDAFQAFSRQVFAAGALDEKTKQLIAVAVAHVTQCPYCIRGHTKAALRKAASEAELMEAIWVAAEMRAGGAYAHSMLALDTAAQILGRPAAGGGSTPGSARHAGDGIRSMFGAMARRRGLTSLLHDQPTSTASGQHGRRLLSGATTVAVARRSSCLVGELECRRGAPP
jgi:AhpD family alkylhydroperoxidase